MTLHLFGVCSTNTNISYGIVKWVWRIFGVKFLRFQLITFIWGSQSLGILVKGEAEKQIDEGTAIGG